ncbi:hypothetical protein N9Y89_00520 [bacterium]|nr:hypothetical protein [bacterium]
MYTKTAWNYHKEGFVKGNFTVKVEMELTNIGIHLILDVHQLKIGDTFYGTHGLVEGGHVHDDYAYEVVGILEPSYSTMDQLILTNSHSVWKVHNHETIDDDHDHANCNHDHDHDHHDHANCDHDHSEEVELSISSVCKYLFLKQYRLRDCENHLFIDNSMAFPIAQYGRKRIFVGLIK